MRSAAAVTMVVAGLIDAATGFEITPQPNDIWLVHVTYDKAQILDDLATRFNPEP